MRSPGWNATEREAWAAVLAIADATPPLSFTETDAIGVLLRSTVEVVAGRFHPDESPRVLVLDRTNTGFAPSFCATMLAAPFASLSNTVSVATIADALRSAGGQMDHDKDILFLILTSHGSQAGVAVQAGRRIETLSPPALAGILDSAGVQHRIVVISACYSGVFLRPLASADTLVITAADAEHSSFGCQDKVKWTYFGDAFFNIALRHAADLRVRPGTSSRIA